MNSGIFVIDKPAGWTSFDVCAKLRGILREKRIGHGGTLDPMATGVLVIFAGKATKAVNRLPGEKTYLASFKTGFTTDSLDITGEITGKFDKTPSKDELLKAIDSFKGHIKQIPPMVSAIKKDGVRLYKYARQGIEVEREPRDVFIESIDYLGEGENGHMIRVVCSAGTYIRTLADDIGASLGCGAVLTALRRERSGPFTLEDAVSISDASWEKALPETILP